MRKCARLAVAVSVLGCGTTQLGGGGIKASVAGNEGRSADASLDRLKGRPAWLFPFVECPADVFPGVEQPIRYLGDACAADVDACLGRCQSGEANACYAAALRLQELKAPSDYSEALFLRACRLGVASGCTNRAAGMIVDVSDKSDLWLCANRTFEAMCDRDDPWACTMWGSSLLQGRGVRPDVARARAVLVKGCRLGEDDPACVAARRWLGEANTMSN
jgi:hypothetical protein